MEQYFIYEGNGVILCDGNGVTEIPSKSRIFTQDHIDYAVGLASQILLNDLKGQWLNIVEGIGLPDKQEIAIKRLVTGVLYDTRQSYKDSLELVRIG
jgi:hypothetical protein